MMIQRFVLPLQKLASVNVKMKNLFMCIFVIGRQLLEE